MTRDAFLREEGGAFAPNEISRGYWRDDSIHGRSLVGLLGQEIERRHGEAGWIPARFSVDMHRLARFRPLTVETRAIREGGRLRLIEATLMQDGGEVARGLCQFLRAGEAPQGRVWAPEPWRAPPPAELASVDDPQRRRLAEWRPVSGEMGTCGQRRIWTREFFDIVEGVPLTPFARVAVAADFGSPWIHSGDAGIKYINTDIVVQLHRLPRGEWLGLESTGHEASQAIAVGNCRFYDEDGPLGYISATALSNERR